MSIGSPPGSIHAIGLIAHPARRCDHVVDEIVAWADAHDALLVALDDETGPPTTAPHVSADTMADNLDLVIAAGGDGTILRALAVAAPAGVPVLGVNLGRLGFLAEVEPPELRAGLTAIATGQYRVEERLGLEALVSTDQPVRPFRASNDVVMTRTPGHRQAELALSVGGELFARYVGDGLILSTPTGSTAYTLSAGGSIVSPVAKTLLVTPLAPHALLNRSLVVDATEQLQVDVLPHSSPLVIECDGWRHAEVSSGARLTAVQSPDASLLVRLGWTTFYGRARGKLQLVDPLELTDTKPTTEDHAVKRSAQGVVVGVESHSS